MTSQSGCGVVRRLETVHRDADLVSLRRLLVVQILTGADWGQDSSSPEATPAETEGKYRIFRIINRTSFILWLVLRLIYMLIDTDRHDQGVSISYSRERAL